MIKPLKSFLLFVIVFLCGTEVVIQLTSYEQNSRIYLYGTYPIGLPPTREVWEERFHQLKEVEEQKLHYATYDSILGWSYHANYASKDSLYVFDEYGMRAHSDDLPDCSHEKECFKVLLSGNSFMMSAEVSREGSLAYFLEKSLSDKGVPAHIYNGAGGNYSIDQAYLQWKYRSKQFKPSVIVLGVNPQSYAGNASLYPYSYFPETNIYYSKPRAIIEGDSLKWVNMPTVAPDRLLSEMVIDFEGGPLEAYEYSQKLPRVVEPSYLPKSYIWSTVSRYTRNMAEPKPKAKKELQELVHALIREFRDEASQEGSQLMLLQTPVFEDVLGEATGVRLLNNPAPYAIDSLAATLYTTELFLDYPLFIQGFTPSLSHYSKSTNQKLAEKLANFILENN